MIMIVIRYREAVEKPHAEGIWNLGGGWLDPTGELEGERNGILVELMIALDEAEGTAAHNRHCATSSSTINASRRSASILLEVVVLLDHASYLFTKSRCQVTDRLNICETYARVMTNGMISPINFCLVATMEAHESSTSNTKGEAFLVHQELDELVFQANS
jgi:hypothetical protein